MTTKDAYTFYCKQEDPSSIDASKRALCAKEGSEVAIEAPPARKVSTPVELARYRQHPIWGIVKGALSTQETHFGRIDGEFLEAQLAHMRRPRAVDGRLLSPRGRGLEAYAEDCSQAMRWAKFSPVIVQFELSGRRVYELGASTQPIGESSWTDALAKLSDWGEAFYLFRSPSSQDRKVIDGLSHGRPIYVEGIFVGISTIKRQLLVHIGVVPKKDDPRVAIPAPFALTVQLKEIARLGNVAFDEACNCEPHNVDVLMHTSSEKEYQAVCAAVSNANRNALALISELQTEIVGGLLGLQNLKAKERMLRPDWIGTPLH